MELMRRLGGPVQERAEKTVAPKQPDAEAGVGTQARAPARSVRMLAAYLDLAARYKLEGGEQQAGVELRGMRVETQTNLAGGEAAPGFPQVEQHFNNSFFFSGCSDLRVSVFRVQLALLQGIPPAASYSMCAAM
jgi:hypothetical protein